MTDVQRRRLVPTDRERELGEQVQDYEHATPAAPQPRSIWAALGDHVRNLDPRTMAGPMLPLVVLAGSSLVSDWDEIALTVLIPEMRTDFGISLQFIVTISTVMGIFSILLAPAMGYLADRVKRVWMLRIGGIIQNLGPIITGLAGGIPMLVGGRMLSGVGVSITRPATFPLLTDYYPLASRARVFAFVGIAGGVGAIFGPTVAGQLASLWGWRGAVVFLGALAAVVSVAFFLLREPIRGYHDRKHMGASEDVAATEQRPVSWAEAWRAARSITTLRRLWYAIPFAVAGRVALASLLPVYLAQEFALGPTARGFIIGAVGVAGLFGLLLAGPVADRLILTSPGRIMTIVGVTFAVNAASVAVLALSPWLGPAVAMALPLGFAQVVILPAFVTLISLVVPARVRGLGLQTIAPWQLLGFLMVPFVAAGADAWGIRGGLALIIPLFVISAVIFVSSSFGVQRDIRAALAASMAEEEARRAKAAGRSKMLICRDVDVSYDGVQVLFGVGLDVEEGETLALLGTNGAGKSTLLRAICGTQEASNGAIFLDGQDVTHVPPHQNAADGIVMVPGGNAIFPTLTVEENLRAAAWMYREDDDYTSERTEEVLTMFPVLRERLQQQAGNLSGGEQQMVALGQAFLMRPRLLMIDELSLGLAPQIVEQLLDVLRDIRAQGTTIILVEQSINVALTIAERAVFMEKGEIRFDGATTELLGQPDLVRSVFMGGAVTGSGARPRTSSPEKDTDRERLLEVDGVSVSFGGVRALRDASVEVGGAEVVGVIGPNGAGKTTLFDVISGFVPPDDGSVTLEAADVTHLTPDARARAGLGRSFQNARLFPSMTVRENIAVALERHVASRNPILAAVWAPQVRRAERRVSRRVEGLIVTLGLTAYADKFVNELSTGTRRAVDIACVMASEPHILLLDEPSSGLAQAETEELGPVFQRLVRDTGVGLLVIEHDIPLITSVSDRMYAMETGEVIATGTPDEVMVDRRVMGAYLSASQTVIGRSGRGGVEQIIRAAMKG